MINHWTNSLWSSFIPAPAKIKKRIEEFLETKYLDTSESNIHHSEVKYLTSPEKLKEILYYILLLPKTKNELKPGDDIERLKKQYEYSTNASALVLRSALCEKIIKNNMFMDTLWIALATTPSPVVFGRVFGIMAWFIHLNAGDCLNYIFKTDFIEAFVHQLGKIEDAQNLLWMIIMVDTPSEGTIYWLTEQLLMKRLVELFVDSIPVDDGELAVSIAGIILNLCSFALYPAMQSDFTFPHDIQINRADIDISPLIHQFEQSDNINLFCRYLFTNYSILSRTIPYLNTFIRSCTYSKPPLFLKIILENFVIFRNILTDNPKTTPNKKSKKKSPTSPKNQQQPNTLGLLRINIIHLLNSLASLRSDEIYSVFISFEIFNLMLQLMLEFPMHSILHNSIVQLFRSCLTNPPQCLSILEVCPLLNFIARQYEQYHLGMKLQLEMTYKRTLRGLCMNQLQEMEKRNLISLYGENNYYLDKNIQKETFGAIAFKNSCHFMGHLMILTKIILQLTSMDNMQSKELKKFIEKHQTWDIIKTIDINFYNISVNDSNYKENYGEKKSVNAWDDF